MILNTVRNSSGSMNLGECSLGQRNLEGSVEMTNQDRSATYEDMLKGFTMFSAVLHCPTGIKLYQFFKNLLERESVRTIIQALVRTLESGKIEGRAHKEKANEFYRVLDKILHLQYGKVLLALSTRSQLQDLLDKDLPFFTNFTQDVRKCLNDSKICERVQHLIQSLGNFFTHP